MPVFLICHSLLLSKLVKMDLKDPQTDVNPAVESAKVSSEKGKDEVASPLEVNWTKDEETRAKRK